jgi:hypothetical protein
MIGSYSKLSQIEARSRGEGPILDTARDPLLVHARLNAFARRIQEARASGEV